MRILNRYINNYHTYGYVNHLNIQSGRVYQLNNILVFLKNYLIIVDLNYLIKNI